MKPWQEIIDAKGNVIIGESLVDLEKAPCNHMECNLGNFFCDATIYSVVGIFHSCDFLTFLELLNWTVPFPSLSVYNP